MSKINTSSPFAMTAMPAPVAYRFWPSARLLVCTLVMTALLLSMATQTVLSMSVVCMVRQQSASGNNDTNANVTDTCSALDDGGVNNTGHRYPGTLDYSKTAIAWLMSAMFWGNLLCFLPGGWLVDRYGTRVPLSAALAVLGVMSLLSPMAARTHWAVLFAIRVIGGGAQGIVMPAAMKICGRWFPKDEIQNVSSVITAGFQIGGLLATLATSNLCDTPWRDGGGWPISFYIWGVLSLLWALLWLAISSAPETQKWFICDAEQKYIVATRSQRSRPTSTANVPYSALLTDPAVWALIAANIALRWKIVLIAMYLPTYYDEALHLTLTQNGESNMMSYLVQIVIKFVVPVAATAIDNRHWFSFTSRAKVFNSVACVGMGAAMLALTFVDCAHIAWAVALPIVSVAFMSFTSAGFVPCFVRVAPPFTGTISGVIMFSGSFVTIATPYAIAAITANGTVAEWDVVFYVSVVMVVLAGGVFAVFGSGEESAWSKRMQAAADEVPSDVTIVVDFEKDSDKCREFEEKSRKY